MLKMTQNVHKEMFRWCADPGRKLDSQQSALSTIRYVVTKVDNETNRQHKWNIAVQHHNSDKFMLWVARTSHAHQIKSSVNETTLSTAHTSHERPVYCDGQLQCSTNTARPAAVLSSTAVVIDTASNLHHQHQHYITLHESRLVYANLQYKKSTIAYYNSHNKIGENYWVKTELNR